MSRAERPHAGTPNAIQVVRAAPGDVDVCFAIARAASIEGFGHVFPPDLYAYPDEAVRAEWASALADRDTEVYLAFEGGEAVGVVAVGGGVLQTLYVAPESWGHGVGSTLHDHAVGRLREMDFPDATLWTLTENHRARSFYERRGWTLTGRRRPVPFPPHPIDVEYCRSTTAGLAAPASS